MKNLKSQSGTSIAEVVIAISLSMAVMLGLLEASRQLSVSLNTVEGGQDTTALMYEVNGILNNGTACTQALNGTSSVNGTELTLKANIRNGASYGKIDLDGVRLQNVNYLGAFNVSAEIEFTGEKRGDVYGTKRIIERTRLFYTVDGANKINECTMKHASAIDDCFAVGGTWSGTKCDFCGSLGGTTNAVSGACELAGP
jgi:hypothetical protein